MGEDVQKTPPTYRSWEPFVHEAPTSKVSQPGSVHEAQTRPAPYVETLVDDAAVGSIPLSALHAVYQPVVDFRTGRTIAFDGDVRCSAEGLTDPRELIARAAFEHRLSDLGRIARERILAECPGRALFLPVRPQELREGFLLRPDDPLYTHDAEIFVQVAQRGYSATCLQVIREVCQGGNVKLAVDDFGAGESSLHDVLMLQPTVVKLDSRLLVGLAEDRRRRDALTRLTELLSGLQAHVVAKGVETVDMLRALRDCGMRFGQGLLFGALSQRPTVSRYSGH